VPAEIILSILFEVRPGVRIWRKLSSLSPDEPRGSFQSETETGRQLYIFGWDDNIPGVWRSSSGYDIANAVVRQVFTAEELEFVADLRTGPYEMVIETTKGPRSARFEISDV
jgi:hypothetical protein